MKRYIKLAGVLLISGLVACEDYLDVNPEMGITAEEIYSDYYNFKGAVDRATNLIHNYVFVVMTGIVRLVVFPTRRKV